MTLSLPKLKVNCGSVLYQAVQVERKPSAGRFPSNKLEAGYAFPSKVGKGEETTVTPEVSLRNLTIPLRCQLRCPKLGCRPHPCLPRRFWFEPSVGSAPEESICRGSTGQTGVRSPLVGGVSFDPANILNREFLIVNQQFGQITFPTFPVSAVPGKLEATAPPSPLVLTAKMVKVSSENRYSNHPGSYRSPAANRCRR